MKTPKRYLFVCMANTNRSPTGARVFQEMIEEKGYSVGGLEEKMGSDFYVGSAGTGVETYEILDGIQYTKEMGDSVDIIFAANRHIVEELDIYFHAPVDRLIDLEIPDVYDVVRNVNDEFALENLMRAELARYVPE